MRAGSINFEIECLPASVHARICIHRPSSLRIDPPARDLFVTALLDGYNRRVDVSALWRSENFREPHLKRWIYQWSARKHASSDIRALGIHCDFISGSTDWYWWYIGLAYILSAFVTKRDFQRSFTERPSSPLCRLIGLASNARWFFIVANVARSDALNVANRSTEFCRTHIAKLVMKIHYCEIANLMRIVDMREINNEKNDE